MEDILQKKLILVHVNCPCMKEIIMASANQVLSELGEDERAFYSGVAGGTNVCVILNV